MYREEEAQPLLLACSESFILNAIITREFRSSRRLMNKLIDKNPKVVVKLFQSSNSNQTTIEINPLALQEYSYLLPRIFKTDSDTFIKLVEKHGSWLVSELNRRSMQKFLKISRDTVIRDANRCINFMDLKMITTNLTKDEFGMFFRNLFPNDLQQTYPSFSFMHMHGHLKFYPQDEAIPLLLSTFEKVYKRSFMEFIDLIEPDFMILLPAEQRISIARKKFAKIPHLRKYEMETFWIMYFPIDESIATLKNHINKTHDFIAGAEHRGKYLQYMIRSCKINNDESALLSVLDYIITRHKNERTDILAEVMEKLMREFPIEKLPSQHWTILDTITNMLFVKDKGFSCLRAVQNLTIGRIHYNLIHKLPITESCAFYFKVSMEMYREWNILTHCLEYERKCLNEFLNIGSTYTPCSSSRILLINYINSFMRSVLHFNERNKHAESPIELISIENFSWLYSKIKELVSSDEKDVDALKLSLKDCRPDLYCDWVKETNIEIVEEKLIDLRKPKEWKKNIEKVIGRWKEYYDYCLSCSYQKYVHRFIKECRWYQILPINFIEQSKQEVFENSDVFSLRICVLLLDGESFEQVVAPFLPSNPSIDFESEDASKDYSIMSAIPDLLSILNPPASLELTARYCRINFIQMAGNWLMTMSRQTPINKVIPFALNLIDKPVSISKHAIRICGITASTKQLTEVLVHIWRNNKHYTIRCLTSQKMFDLFLSKPSIETWLMINECLDGLTVDDSRASRCLFNVRCIPKEYTIEYIRKLFVTLQRLQCIQTHTTYSENDFMNVSNLIRSLFDIAHDFPEELHEEIIRTYFADLTQPEHVRTVAEDYLIIVYITLAKERLDLRLQFISGIFLDILGTKCDVAHSQDSSKYRARKLTESLSEKMMWIGIADIRNAFIDIMTKNFSAVLKPWEVPKFYLRCAFTSVYCDGISTREYTSKIVNIIPSLIATFSIGFVDEMGELLAECMGNLFRHNPIAVVDIIEHLIEINDEHIMILAFKVLVHQNQSRYYERYEQILNNLRQQPYPAVLAHVYMKINSQ